MIINNALLDSLTEQAKANPRLRQSFDLRNSPDDESQRMLNAIEPGSEMPIHRHQHTSETVVCLRGCLIEEFFDELERICTDRIELTPNGPVMAVNVPGGQGTGTEVNPNCWTVKQSLRIREPACTGQVTYH